MSRENVEAVRAIIDAWNRGDRDGWAELAHPEVEWSSAILRQLEGQDTVHHGRAGLQRFWDEWHAVWNMEITISETRDLGDAVLALAHIRTRGASSGVEVERSMGYVFEFEDGLVRRASAYLTPAEAFDAVGLRE